MSTGVAAQGGSLQPDPRVPARVRGERYDVIKQYQQTHFCMPPPQAVSGIAPSDIHRQFARIIYILRSNSIDDMKSACIPHRSTEARHPPNPKRAHVLHTRSHPRPACAIQRSCLQSALLPRGPPTSGRPPPAPPPRRRASGGAGRRCR